MDRGRRVRPDWEIRVPASLSSHWGGHRRALTVLVSELEWVWFAATLASSGGRVFVLPRGGETTISWSWPGPRLSSLNLCLTALSPPSLPLIPWGTPQCQRRGRLCSQLPSYFRCPPNMPQIQCPEMGRVGGEKGPGSDTCWKLATFFAVNPSASRQSLHLSLEASDQVTQLAGPMKWI